MENHETTHEITPEYTSLFLFEGQFRFKTFAEAQALATYLSNACPNPRLAIFGIAEILINAVEHGNLGISYEEKTNLQKENRWMEEIERRLKLPENINKYVTVVLKRTETELHIKVTDEGQGFDWKKFENLNHSTKENRLHTHGRGIPIAKNVVFSKLEFMGKGNEVLGVIPL